MSTYESRFTLVRVLLSSSRPGYMRDRYVRGDTTVIRMMWGVQALAWCFVLERGSVITALAAALGVLLHCCCFCITCQAPAAPTPNTKHL